MLTRYSASLRLPPSLPLMSPYGLPSAGYPASARWHVFAPAHLALSGSLRESPERLPKPPGSRETIWFGFISSQISQLEVGDGVAGECWMT